MKLLFLAFAFLIITITAKAETLRGTIRQLNGYSALETEEAKRLLMPKWMNSKILSEIPNLEIILEGSTRENTCTGELQGCPTHEIYEVKWIQFQNTDVPVRNNVYTGLIKLFFGTKPISYFALEAGTEKVEIPNFLNPLYLYQMQPQITLMGEIVQSTSGPSKLSVFSMLKLQF